MNLIVIGAGASGLMAAITAAGNGSRVIILEHKDKAGKKILATGNGKCNYTNKKMTDDCYRGNKDLIQHGLSVFNSNDAVNFFTRLGVISKEKNGYMYPNSGQATTILNSLIDEALRLGVRIVTECEISSINHKKGEFIIKSNRGSYKAQKIIVAVGLLASPKLGSDGSFLLFLKGFGHRFNPIVPALCGFNCDGFSFKKVSGVRTDASVTAIVNNKELCSDTGELQLTDYGLSGIPVFQISRFLSMGLYEKADVKVKIDLMPEYSNEKLHNMLTELVEKSNGFKSWIQMLSGLLNSKLSTALLEQTKINPTAIINIDKNDIKKVDLLSTTIKSLIVNVKSYRDYEFAQVCAGGINSEEIDIKTLESKLVPGMFFAGEILDVDGICGGYNLQWAWTSGYIAGLNAGK